MDTNALMTLAPRDKVLCPQCGSKDWDKFSRVF